MANFAIVKNNVAVDVSAAPNEYFHPSIAAQFVPVPDEVMVGWVKSGSLWSAPSSAILVPTTPTLTPEQSIVAARRTAKKRIDDTVATVYSGFQRFAPEYELREKQAQAYKDGGYTGTVPVQVEAYRASAGLTARQATDTILAQAASLRSALSALGALRMRKNEVDVMTDTVHIDALVTTVLGQVAIIAAQL